MVEIMKTMATPFKRSCVCTAAFSTPDLAACHCQSMPLLETPGHSQASLGQSLLGSLLFSPGSWCTQGFVCALQESVSPVCVISGGSIVELMATFSKSAPGLGHPEPLPLWHATADLHLHRRLSSTQSHVKISGALMRKQSLYFLPGTRDCAKTRLNACNLYSLISCVDESSLHKELKDSWTRSLKVGSLINFFLYDLRLT